MDILLVAIQQYVFILVFIAIAYGAGYLVIRPLDSTYLNQHREMRVLLTVTTGIGVLILLLFVLALVGHLKPLPIIILSVMFSLMSFIKLKNCISSDIQKIQKVLNQYPYWSALLLILALPLIVKPLQLPYSWDELMYHLPHAQIWADQGRLTVNENIRYSLFAYNLDLLYAATLVFDQPVFTHLIHASMAWLTAFGIFVFSKEILHSKFAALIAMMLYLESINSLFGTAFVDLGLTTYIFFSFIAVCLWWQTREITLLFLGIFLLGIAVGIKYQGLMYLPIFLLLVLYRERRIPVLFICLGVFLASGSHWYLYNYLISGNPFPPLGGEIFGYWNWDKLDMQHQLKDIDVRFGLPDKYYFIGLYSLLFMKRHSTNLNGLIFISLTSTLLWLLTSGYERYISYSYPFFTILTAYSLQKIYTAYFSQHKTIGLGKVEHSFLNKKAFKSILIIAALINTGSFLSEYSKRISWSEENIHEVYKRDSGLYEILSVAELPVKTRLYQLGYEGEIFYSPVTLYGDWFGPYRYREFLKIKNNPEAMSAYLKERQLDGIVVNNDLPYSNLKKFEAAEKFFILKDKTERASLYLLK